MKEYYPQDRDELRGRFTRYLGLLVRNAKIDYLRKQAYKPPTISIDEIPEELLARDSPLFCEKELSFDFEEERLAQAFYSLPLMRQQILTLLFVKGWKPAQVAKHLNCSVQYVYNQRFLAIKKLRQLLQEEGDIR